MKAIETKYKGYRFRSRLEARWAVFFDAMDEEWEYEKQGYDLGCHGYYLPDFYLPRFDSHIEIKGAPPTRSDLKKADALRDHLGTTVAIFHGLPGANLGTLFTFDIGDSSAGYSECDVCLGNDPHDGSLLFGVFFTHRVLYKDMNFTEELPYLGGEYIPCEIVEIASDAAKAARFEHGENGTR